MIFDSTSGRKLRPKTKVKPKRRPKPKAKAPARAPAPEVSLLDEQVAAATNMAYGGAENALRGEMQVSGQMQASIPRWYQEYRSALQQATNQTGAGYAAVNQLQTNTANTSSALDAQQRATQMQGMQQDAALRGATVDPQIDATGQQAAAARRAMLDSFAGLTARQGAAEVGFRANRQVVGAGQQLQAQVGEGNRARSLAQKGTELAKEKGQYAVTARQKILDNEHTKDLENKAFGLDVAEAEAKVANDQAQIAERRRARVTTNRNADQSRAIAERRAAEQERANRAREARGSSTASNKQKVKENGKFRANIDTAAADVRTLRNAKVPVRGVDGKPEVGKDDKPTGRTRKLSESEIRAAMRKKYKDRDIANAAMDLAILGHVSPANQRRLRARGIGVPKSWLPKQRTAAQILQNPSGVAGLSQTLPR